MSAIGGMRVEFDGVSRPEEPFEFRFEGRPVAAYPGESLAAALVAGGDYGFRDEDGEPRGLFCGMGVCGECDVLVDGHPRRACMEKALPGMDVRRHPAVREPCPAKNGAADDEWQERAPDVLVVGAGPAGLSAAIAAADSGLDVVVVDERQQPGGQYYKQPPVGFRVSEAELDRQFSDGRRLAARALASGVRLLAPVTVVAAFGGGDGGPRIAVATADGMQMMSARRVVIANGAYERPLPFPGWTLPGIMTTGAAQTLLRGYQVAAGRRILVAGNGPLNLQVAWELSRAGATVVAVAELAANPFARLPAAARLLRHGPRLALAGLEHLAGLARRRVPVLYRHALTLADGDARVRRATLARFDANGRRQPGTERRFYVDAVCLNYGFLPQSELARALGCAYVTDAATGNLRCERELDGQTGVPRVYVVGDAGGLGGAKLAADQGALAGSRIAQELAAPRPPPLDRLVELEKRVVAHGRFQAALWALFRAPRLTTELATADTLICRCESLALGTLQAAAAAGRHDLAALKRRTRAGMGRCQGRYCGTSLNAILGAAGAATGPGAFFAPRPPFKPVPIGVLAGRTGREPEPEDILAAPPRFRNE